jgi:two-component system, cell cycle response regulator DivK
VSSWSITVIACARESLPDAILMDVSTPIIDGLEATRVLKADPVTAGIPVVILTAHAMAEDREKAFEAGGDAYLSKPVEPKRVAEEIWRVLAGSPAM